MTKIELLFSRVHRTPPKKGHVLENVPENIPEVQLLNCS